MRTMELSATARPDARASWKRWARLSSLGGQLEVQMKVAVGESVSTANWQGAKIGRAVGTLALGLLLYFGFPKVAPVPGGKGFAAQTATGRGARTGRPSGTLAPALLLYFGLPKVPPVPDAKAFAGQPAPAKPATAAPAKESKPALNLAAPPAALSA